MSSDLVWKECNFCGDTYIPLKHVLFFQCGHKACESCVGKIYHCPICRERLQGPHRIFLTADELTDEPAANVVEGLKKVDMNTPAPSLKKAGGKIERLRKRADGDGEVSKALLDAATDLKERLAPLVEKYTEVRKENEELQSRLHQLHATSEAHRSKISRAKELAQREKDEGHRQRERAEKYLSVVRQKEAEILRLQQSLEDRDKDAGLMKTKLKALAKAQKHASRSAPNPDVSLQIEGQPEITPQKRQKRLPSTVLHELNAEPPTHQLKRRKVPAISRTTFSIDD